ncbi:serine protease easter [Aedes aegypti]|uniref:CLIP domain-containing serine protease n=1 Tax=Aedes aegypti TaxID=7159 RepID=Q1HQI3_AEDAE|nr:serine protease easter [Aedes aegypti]ABF18494.1 clip-domain serine protease [Aedes aegypti]
MRFMVSNLVTLATVVTLSAQLPQPALEDVGPVWEVTTQCSIPNESNNGTCTSPTECPAYATINNPEDLSSVGRLSFLKRIQCNSEGTGGICCPLAKRYKTPTLNETLPKRIRHKTTRVHSRFGNDDEVCGYQSFVPKIRGGEIANIDEFPWMAMLLYELKESQKIVHGCGGALISKNFVITAAHCVTGKDYDNKGPLKYVRLREYNVYDDPDCVIEHNFQDCSEEKIDSEPVRIIVHPEYDPNFRHKYHDIALIEISRVPSYTDFLRHICLPEPKLDNGVAPGKRFSVSGWGRTDIFRQQLGNNALSPIKLKVVLPYVEPEQCRRVFRAQQLEIGPGQLCAGGEKAKDTCGGDSGSPLMFYDVKAGAWVLTGIVSLGVRDCGTEGIPGVYTNVRQYLDWIKANAQM